MSVPGRRSRVQLSIILYACVRAYISSIGFEICSVQCEFLEEAAAHAQIYILSTKGRSVSSEI